VGEGADRAVRGYWLFECPGKARPARSSHVKQLFVWGSPGWGQGLGKGPKPLASFLFPRKGKGVPRPPQSENVPSQVFMWGLICGYCPTGGRGAWDPSTPLVGLWEKTEHKEGGWPSELGDRAALIQGCPEVGVPSTGTSCPPENVPRGHRHLIWSSRPISDFLTHFTNSP
jgi:hypothetical protein